MTTTTVPTDSLAAELDGLIARSDDLDTRLARTIAECDRLIARLEAMNPAQVAAMAAFADLPFNSSAAWADEEPL